MFDQDEIKFLKEDTEKSLAALEGQIRYLSAEMAYNGKHLADLLEKKNNLESITERINASEKD